MSEGIGELGSWTPDQRSFLELEDAIHVGVPSGGMDSQNRMEAKQGGKIFDKL